MKDIEGDKSAKLALFSRAIKGHIERGVGSTALSVFIHRNPECEEEAYRIYQET